MHDKEFLTQMEVIYQFGLGEKFISDWTARRAQDEYEAGRTAIPGMPVIMPGERGMLFPKGLLREWLLRYFGRGYKGDEEKKGARK